MKEYSKTLAKRIMDFLDADDWKYEFIEEKGVITFGAKIGSILKRIDYTICVEDDFAMVYASPTLKADGKNPEMMEIIHKLNYKLRSGALQLDPEDGDLRLRLYLEGGEENLPTKRMMETALYLPGNIFTEYGDAIVRVALGDATAKEAFDEAENRRMAASKKEVTETPAERLMRNRNQAQSGENAEPAPDVAEDDIKISLFEEEGGDEE